MSGSADGRGLVIDHSGRVARVGLGVGGGWWEDATEPSRRHLVDALAAADRLVRAAGLEPADLDWLGWVTGPGSFTGLRVAAATAQALKLTRTDKPLRVAGVPATEALLAAEPDAVAALAVKRGEAWSAGPGMEPGLRPLEEVRARAGGRRVLADEPHGDAPAGVDLRVLFRLAAARVADGRCDRPEDLRPLYPREPEAVTIWERNQRR